MFPLESSTPIHRLFMKNEIMGFLTLEHFAARLNDTFISADDGEAAFVLIEASPLPAQTPEELQRVPFSLLFRNAAPIVFQQKTFLLRHAELGQMGIFLVPVARDSHGYVYQAIFN